MTDEVKKIFLEKSATFFMAPFFYDDDTLRPSDSIWQARTKPFNNDNDVLFPYIMETLRGKTLESSSNIKSLSIYQLVTPQKGNFSGGIWHQFANKKHFATIKGHGEVSFKFHCSDSIRAPHLFVSEEAKVGLLMFAVEVEGNVNDLKLLNYNLHRIDHSFKDCYYEISDSEPYSEKEERLYRNINATGKLDSESRKAKWDMQQIVNLLLYGDSDVKSTNAHFTLFSNIRLHMLTYHIADGRNGGWPEEEIVKPLLYLSHCQKDSYMLPTKQIQQEGGMMKTYENIYVSSSIEACSIIAIARDDNYSFFKDFDSKSIANRYLWIYILALMQRYVMLNITRQLVEVEATGNDEKLWQLLDTYKHLKTSFYYSDVSQYSHHTQFYRHCCRGLHITETFDELDHKTAAINLVSDHNLQTILRQKEQDEKQRESKSKSSDRLVARTVATLTIIQAFYALYGMFDEWLCRIWKPKIVMGSVAFVIILYIWIQFFFQRKNK